MSGFKPEFVYWNREYMNREFRGQPRGIIYSFTKVSQAPSSHEEFEPYVCVVVDVELENGQTRRMSMRMTDLDPNSEIQIGDPVEIVTRVWKREGERGYIIHGYAARSPLRLEGEGQVKRERM